MKTIKNLTKQEIVLEGFGVIEIKENLSGEWQVDLFPRNSKNNREKIQIETTFSAIGDKYFEYPKENKNRIDDIYKSNKE
jgi:hypothetical protein